MYEETEKVLIGYDYSGSTQMQRVYHSKTQQILNEYRSRSPIIIRWGSEAIPITIGDLDIINNKLDGKGGTFPSTLAKYIEKIDFHGVLVLITDGEVEKTEISICSEILKTWKFAYVIVHLIKNAGTVNESVSLPFTRNSEHRIVLYDDYGMKKRHQCNK